MVCLVSAACLGLFAFTCRAEPQGVIGGMFGDSLKVKHSQDTRTIPAGPFIAIGKFASVYVPLESLAHWYLHSMLWLALAAAAIVTLRYTWYRFLPPPGEDAD